MTRQEQITEFVGKLYELERADLARLKRNAGETLADARGVTALFFRLLPYGVGKHEEPFYFLIATLFALADGDRSGRNLGQLFHSARQKSRRSEKSFDRRFEVLLDADSDQIAFRLRQIVQLLASEQVSIDWGQLLGDLLAWDHPDRYIQMRWARAYYRTEKADAAPAAANS